ncbi:MAG: SHOCT domain-containing protein [Lactobacillus sp.]|nr:SHOCT domain-containing protein [Lactobacillus sp.]
MAKYKFSSTRDPILWADNHTVEDFKKYIDQGKDFSDIELEIEQKRQKRSAEEEQKKQEIAAFKKKSVRYSHYYFNRTERKIYIGKTFLDPDRFVDASEIVSYQVNEKGHDENKHHVFTRAAVGAIIAGTPGAVIAGTTGGKINEYIDHLGLIINLSDGSDFEVKFLTIKSKTNSSYAKDAYSELNHVIAILDGWKATEKVVEDTKDNTDAPAEIRRYKQLLDDGIITQEEFEAKKKQLLGL